MQTRLRTGLIVAAAWAAVTTASAAPITWQAATPTSGKVDLIEGTVIAALNGGPSAPVVIGGGAGGGTLFEFTANNYTDVAPHIFVATAGGPNPRGRTTASCYTPAAIESTGDADFDTMIQSMTDAWGTTAGITAGTLTLNGLIDGTDYTVQVFFNDQRDAYDDRVMTYGDGLGSTRDLAGGDPTTGVQTNHYGQYVIGTFTASGSAQDLTMLANGFGNIHFGAIVVTGPIGINLPPGDFDDTFSVLHQAPTGTVVGTLYAEDFDGPAAVTYTITAGNDGDAFALDPDLGELTVAGPIDNLAQAVYTLTVEAYDGQLTTPATITVHVQTRPVTVSYTTQVLGEAEWYSIGFGRLGYIFFSTDDNDLDAGAYKRGGVVYNSDEVPAPGQTIMFSRLAQGISAWDARGGSLDNELTTALNVALENPDGGSFFTGSLQNTSLATNDFADSFSLTFTEEIPGGIRIGLLVGAKETQGAQGLVGGTTGNLRDVPYQLQVDSVSVTTTQTALDPVPAPDWLSISPDHPDTGVPRADWYFFDLNDITAGSSVTISATRIYADYSHKFNPVNGVVISARAPLITRVLRMGTTLMLDFAGDPGITTWKIMAGTDLQSFPFDETPASIPEGPAGSYQAEVDVTGDPADYFIRIEP